MISVLAFFCRYSEQYVTSYVWRVWHSMNQRWEEDMRRPQHTSESQVLWRCGGDSLTFLMWGGGRDEDVRGWHLVAKETHVHV